MQNIFMITRGADGFRLPPFGACINFPFKINIKFIQDSIEQASNISWPCNKPGGEFFVGNVEI